MEGNRRERREHAKDWGNRNGLRERLCVCTGISTPDGQTALARNARMHARTAHAQRTDRNLSHCSLDLVSSTLHHQHTHMYTCTAHTPYMHTHTAQHVRKTQYNPYNTRALILRILILPASRHHTNHTKGAHRAHMGQAFSLCFSVVSFS